MSLTMIARCWNEPPLLRAFRAIGRPFRNKILRQLDIFMPQAHADDAHACSDDTFQMVVALTSDLDIRHLLKTEHAGVEVDGTIQSEHSGSTFSTVGWFVGDMRINDASDLSVHEDR